MLHINETLSNQLGYKAFLAGYDLKIEIVNSPVDTCYVEFTLIGQGNRRIKTSRITESRLSEVDYKERYLAGVVDHMIQDLDCGYPGVEIWGPGVSIERVLFRDPATIIFWSDDTKTAVAARNGEPFDPEKGLAVAISKKFLGNKGNFNNVFKKFLSEYEDKEETNG